MKKENRVKLFFLSYWWVMVIIVSVGVLIYDGAKSDNTGGWVYSDYCSYFEPLYELEGEEKDCRLDKCTPVENEMDAFIHACICEKTNTVVYKLCTNKIVGKKYDGDKQDVIAYVDTVKYLYE